MIKIRKARKGDFKKFSEIKKLSIKEYCKIADKRIKLTNKQIKKEFIEILSSNKRFLLFIEIKKEIVGCLIGTLIINVYQKIGYIDDIFVLKEYRKRGLGALLIKYFIKMLKRKNIKKYKLGVNIKNKRALKFYKRLGFKIYHYEMEKEIK